MRTKALLIGIKYNQGWGELPGCHKDVERMREFLQMGPWKFNQIKMLTDKPEQKEVPDRKTIIASLRWLVKDAQPGDSLFLHYAGHGYQRPTKSDTEPDNLDEVIIPLDCPPLAEDRTPCLLDCKCRPGNKDCSKHSYREMIRDNDLKDILVKNLPSGCQLTAVFDCCSSGSILDLEYFFTGYLADNTPHTPNIPLRRTARGPQTVKRRVLSNYNSGPSKPNLLVDEVDSFTLGREFRCDSPVDFLSPVVSLNSNFLGVKAWENASPHRSKSSSLPRRANLGPQVTVFSACRDGQNTFEIAGNGGGLLTTTFIEFLIKSRYNLTYQQLISKMRDVFHEKNEARKGARLPEAPYPILSCNCDLDVGNQIII